MSQLSWPERYEVVVRFDDGSTEMGTVVTWHDAAKAIAIAKHHASGERTITEASATSLGRASRAHDGTVELGDDLHDRLEW